MVDEGASGLLPVAPRPLWQRALPVVVLAGITAAQLGTPNGVELGYFLAAVPPSPPSPTARSAPSSWPPSPSPASCCRTPATGTRTPATSSPSRSSWSSASWWPGCASAATTSW